MEINDNRLKNAVQREKDYVYGFYNKNIRLYNLLNVLVKKDFPSFVDTEEFIQLINNQNYRDSIKEYMSYSGNYSDIENKKMSDFFKKKNTNRIVEEISGFMFLNFLYMVLLGGKRDANNFYCEVDNSYNTFRVRIYDCPKERIEFAKYDELSISLCGMTPKQANSIHDKFKSIFKYCFIRLEGDIFDNLIDDKTNVFLTDKEKKIGKNEFKVDVNNPWERFILESDDNLESQVSKIVHDFKASFENRKEARSLGWAHIHVRDDYISVNFEGYNSYPPEVRLIFDIRNLSKEEVKKVGDTVYNALGGREMGERLTYEGADSLYRKNRFNI